MSNAKGKMKTAMRGQGTDSSTPASSGAARSRSIPLNTMTTQASGGQLESDLEAQTARGATQVQSQAQPDVHSDQFDDAIVSPSSFREVP